MKKLVVITGPTASGKTALSIILAEHFKSEIISSDSRQFYKGMDIGTAKPSESELKKIPHHFINFLEPDEKYNIGKFETDAIEKINLLFKKHDLLFLTGGSGLYIDAVCTGIDDLPETDVKVRSELNDLYKTNGIKSLQKKLFDLDPEYYSEVDLNNPHRLMRAIEVTITSGKKYSSFRKKTSKQRNFSVKKIGLLVDREELYDKINNRVNEMINNGFVKEVESLLPYRDENALQTVGYKEIIEFLDRKISLEEAINFIKQNTRNYAKRQMTWFRRDPEIKWFEPSETESMIRFIQS
jgi:tRNA dimethylallyltransferase